MSFLTVATIFEPIAMDMLKEELISTIIYAIGLIILYLLIKPFIRNLIDKLQGK